MKRLPLLILVLMQFAFGIGRAQDDLTIAAEITQIKCYGDTNGSIAAFASGGIGGPYKYKLADQQQYTSYNTFKNLIPGSYTVMAMDRDSDIGSAIAVINTVDQINIIGGELCCLDGGAENGTWTRPATVIGGTPPYTYLWSDGTASLDWQIYNSPTNLNPGEPVSLMITDDNACVDTFKNYICNYRGSAWGNYYITVGPPPKCHGESTGTIMVHMHGLANPLSIFYIAPYVYRLNTGQTITATTADLANYNETPSIYDWGYHVDTFSNLPAGMYQVTLYTYFNNPADTMALLSDAVEITGPQSQLNIGGDVVDVTECDSDNYNGQILLTVSGGEQPYQFTWAGPSDVGDEQNPDNLFPGNYTCTVTDDNGCTISAGIEIKATTICAKGITSDITCIGLHDGSVRETVTGGTPPYMFSLNGGPFGPSPVFSNLAPGNYSVVVEDANDVTTEDEDTINESTPVIVTDTIVNASGPTDSDGAILLHASGGTSPYTYRWNNGPVTSYDEHLLPGRYWVIVTDTNFCAMKDTFTVGDDNSAFTLTGVVSHQPTCSYNGAVTVHIHGGHTPYYYYYDEMTDLYSYFGIFAYYTSTGTRSTVDSFTINGLDGNPLDSLLWVYVIDTTGQADSISFLLDYRSQIYTTNTAATDAGCNGHSGIIRLNTYSPAIGGTPPYTFHWSNGATGDSIGGLMPGTYSFVITDSLGCTYTNQATVPSVSQYPLSFNSNYVSPEHCLAEDGFISTYITGGVFPYLFIVSPINRLDSLPAGIYSITITDQSGCSTTVTDTVPKVGLDLQPQVAYSNCTDPNGYVILTPLGSWPFTYHWSNAVADSANMNLRPGTYYVTVSDANNCSALDSFSVQADYYTIEMGETIVDAGCDHQGSIAFHTDPSPGNFGGLPPYSFAWADTTLNDSVRTGLGAGHYAVTVTDGYGCSASVTVTLGHYLTLSTLQQNANCNINNGHAVAEVGCINCNYLHPPKISYQWSTGATTDTITNLPPGSYFVYASDSSGCLVFDSVIIKDIGPVIHSAVVDPFCRLGSISLTATDGQPPYSYQWSTGATTASISNLAINIVFVNSQGGYAVTVTDITGCSATALFSIFGNYQQNIYPFYFRLDSTPSSCGMPNGRASVETYSSLSGTPPFSYVWSNGSTASFIDGLYAGTYSVSTTDFYGCTTSSSTTVIDSSAPIISFVSNNPQCDSVNGNITVVPSGNWPPYTYLWQTLDTSQSITGLSGGTYTVTITGQNNCIGVASDTLLGGNVIVPSSVSISVWPSDSLTYDTAVVFTATGINGGPRAVYQWILNGSVVSAGSNNVFMDSMLYNGDVIRCIMTSSLPCAVPVVDTSNSIIMRFNIFPSLRIVSGNDTFYNCGAGKHYDTICPGVPTMLTALPANGGTQPYYYMYVNNLYEGYNYSGRFYYQFHNHDSVIITLTTNIYNANPTTGQSCRITMVERAPVHVTVKDTVCYGQSYLFNNRILSDTGIYTDTLTGVNGCDSIVTLGLTILPPISTSFNTSICYGQSYAYAGQQFTGNGAYSVFLTARNGCDSLVVLNLTTRPLDTVTVSQTICPSNSYAGYTQTGTYVDTFTAVNSCDSIRTLLLQVNRAYNDTLFSSICRGDTFSGHYTSGFYTDSLTSSLGCDSVVSLQLTIVNIIDTATVSGHVCRVAQAGVAYQWINCSNGQAIQGATSQSYTATQNGSYHCAITDGNCTDTTNCAYVVSIGLTEVTGYNFSLYPNPNLGVFVIQHDYTSPVRVQIFSILGDKLKEYDLANKESRFDISELAAGVYEVRIADDKQMLKIFKVLKQ